MDKVFHYSKLLESEEEKMNVVLSECIIHKDAAPVEGDWSGTLEIQRAFFLAKGKPDVLLLCRRRSLGWRILVGVGEG